MARRLSYLGTLSVLALMLPSASTHVSAQAGTPMMLAPTLDVHPVIDGLTTPVSVAFLAADDMLVVEKNTGRVKRIVNSVVSTVLDLAVNSSSERGLLGIALHPNFATNSEVYLYWTCTAPPPPTSNPFFPSLQECSDPPELSADSSDILAVPLRGNRVDRFIWNGSTLTFDRNLVKLRAFQNDGAPLPVGQGDSSQPARGNNNGGVIRFGPDGKLYIIIGDNGRRGHLQNLACGPADTCPGATMMDDQFGGPEPDNAHLAGVILRLNDDGTTPQDNPFYAAGASMGGEAGANIQKIFAYGVRNSFGLAFDPVSGALWDQENGDDSFDELNRIDAGSNLGWIQIMGPAERVPQFKQIETTFGSQDLQQFRWPPTRLADTAQEALSRLVMLPGSHYSDPAFSWKFALAPAGIGFLNSVALGPQYKGDLFVGSATTNPVGGYLFHFNLQGNRRGIAVNDPRLQDRVADNSAKFDLTESESLLIGQDFGVTTDIQTGPNGNLFVVSLTRGAVYEIFRR
jgi:aldose sugar dehydrogenase